MRVEIEIAYSYFSVRSSIIDQRGGVLAWRCWILGLPGSSSRVVQMEVRFFFMYRFASSLSAIHLQASKTTCLGFVVISWASLLSKFLFFWVEIIGGFLVRVEFGGVGGRGERRFGGCWGWVRDILGGHVLRRQLCGRGVVHGWYKFWRFKGQRRGSDRWTLFWVDLNRSIVQRGAVELGY